MDVNHNDKLNAIQELSVQDFLDVGLNQIAYIRQMKGEEQEAEQLYVVHAADGSQISVMDSYDRAVAAIRVNDLMPITLH